MAECQRITDRRFFLCNRNRPRSAVLQQLAVLVVRVAYGPVSKEASLIILPAASTIRAVMALWISFSQTTGIPSSFSREFAAHGMMPISPCSAFQHWIAMALQEYFAARFFIATFRAATFSSSSGLIFTHILVLQ